MTSEAEFNKFLEQEPNQTPTALQSQSSLTKAQSSLTKIENNLSKFQILKPKGDFELPRDEENSRIQRNKLIEQMTLPLQGVSLYSDTTIKLKLQMDSMLREYFEEIYLSDDNENNL